MKYLVLLLISSMGQTSFGQNVDTLTTLVFPCDIGKPINLTKEAIVNAFSESIDQPIKGKISAPHNDWLTCNNDSSYFKSDTIYFCSNSYYRHKSNAEECCQFVSWTFYEPAAFLSIRLNTCNEPTTASVVTAKDFYEIKLEEKNGAYYLHIFNQSALIESFKIISLETYLKCSSSKTSNTLTLVRHR